MITTSDGDTRITKWAELNIGYLVEVMVDGKPRVLVVRDKVELDKDSETMKPLRLAIMYDRTGKNRYTMFEDDIEKGLGVKLVWGRVE